MQYNNIKPPWVEKYRPKTADNILLDPFIKEKIDNILKSKSIPNMIITGDPSVGKTSTIICLAKEIYRTASEHHYSLYQSQQYIIGVIRDLERKLEKAINRDRELNQARGNIQYHTRHKKGKKRKHTRKRRP